MSTQKELKQKYADILAADVWHDDKEMIDFCLKEVGYIVELVNGDIIVIKKPKIKKDFCFGYSDSRYDTDDYDRANAAAAHAASSTDYFIEQNLRDISEEIAGLEEGRWNYRIRIPYSGQPADSQLKGIQRSYWCNEEAEQFPKLEGENLKRVIDGYKAVKADFEKRLQRYLKRYGLSKVHAWSYWRDE